MITPEYCRTMARYNAWQNSQLNEALEGASLEALRAERGAFFGSILGTLSHLLWGDQIWMSRFDPSVTAPDVGIPESADMCPTLAAWNAERQHLDGKISHWAESVRAVDLTGELTWQSMALGREVCKTIALCVTHMFNHQTHHRGQLHQMLTSAGFEAPVSDLFYLPET